MNDGERHLYEWQRGMSGHFVSALFEACACADNMNLQRLKIGFPKEVLAFYRFSREEGYWQALQEEYQTDLD